MLRPAHGPDQTHVVHGGVLGDCAARGPRNGADNLARDVAACRAPACADLTDGHLRWLRAGAGKSAACKHDLSCYSLRGSSPRPMAHKTIALTTELREHLLPRGQQVDMCTWLLGTLLCRARRLDVHCV